MARLRSGINSGISALGGGCRSTPSACARALHYHQWLFLHTPLAKISPTLLRSSCVIGSLMRERHGGPWGFTHLRCIIRFPCAATGFSFLRKWRQDKVVFSEAANHQLYASWRVSKERARDEFLFRRLCTWATPLLQAPVEKDKAKLAVYSNRVLVARIEDGEIIQATGWLSTMRPQDFKASLAEQEAQATQRRFRL